MSYHQTTCRTCQGKGHFYQYEGSDVGNVLVSCDVCHGKGKVSSTMHIEELVKDSRDFAQQWLMDSHSSWGVLRSALDTGISKIQVLSSELETLSKREEKLTTAVTAGEIKLRWKTEEHQSAVEALKILQKRNDELAKAFTECNTAKCEITKNFQDFKDVAHKKLDDMGVPEFGPEKCRIGARLDWVAKKLKKDVKITSTMVLHTPPPEEKKCEFTWLGEQCNSKAVTEDQGHPLCEGHKWNRDWIRFGPKKEIKFVSELSSPLPVPPPGEKRCEYIFRGIRCPNEVTMLKSGHFVCDSHQDRGALDLIDASKRILPEPGRKLTRDEARAAVHEQFGKALMMLGKEVEHLPEYPYRSPVALTEDRRDPETALKRAVNRTKNAVLEKIAKLWLDIVKS